MMYSWNATKNTSLVVTFIWPWAAKQKAVSVFVRPRGNFRAPRLNGDGSQYQPFPGGLQWDEEDPNSQPTAEDISSPIISVAVPGLNGDAAVEHPPPPAPLPQQEPELPNHGSGVADIGTYCHIWVLKCLYLNLYSRVSDNKPVLSWQPCLC